MPQMSSTPRSGGAVCIPGSPNGDKAGAGPSTRRRVPMAQTVADVMTRDPRTVERDRPVTEAARLMRDADSGAVIVLDNGTVAGIVTDRDITVRVVAEGRDINSATVADAASAGDVTTVGPDT